MRNFERRVLDLLKLRETSSLVVVERNVLEIRGANPVLKGMARRRVRKMIKRIARRAVVASKTLGRGVKRMLKPAARKTAKAIRWTWKNRKDVAAYTQKAWTAAQILHSLYHGAWMS